MTYVVFDLESIPLPIPEEAIAEKRLALSQEYKKDETIEAHLLAWKDKFKFKPEGAKPIAIGMQIIGHKATSEPMGIQSDDESEIARFFVETIDTFSGSKIVGYNILGYDLPLICRSLFKSDLKLNYRIGKWAKIDLMQEPFGRGFDQTGGFKRLCRTYGVKLSGQDGSMVDALWAEDQENGTKKVLEYCLDDVRGCGELFMKFQRFFDFG